MQNKPIHGRAAQLLAVGFNRRVQNYVCEALNYKLQYQEFPDRYYK